MARINLTKKISSSRSGKKHHGFTLVELIVVLAILAILAAVGVFASIGYINRSRFDQNTQNAITVYQTAQVALVEMNSNGTIDTWCRNIETIKGVKLFDEELENSLIEDKQIDRSITKKIELTYNPNSASDPEDQYLHDMLFEYFYDKSIFTGTMSLEMEITATYGNGKVNYSARVLSAFYSNENTHAENKAGGWDSLRIGKEAGRDWGYSTEFPELPRASGDDGYVYRRTKSFVGWFNGTSESISTTVLPVFLPQSTIQPLDGHIVAGDETGYLFNLYNGETLDVAWAIFDEDGEAHEYHKEDLVITLKSAGNGNSNDEIHYGNDPADKMSVKLKITKENLETFLESVRNSNTTVKHEKISVYDITRTSREGFISVIVDDSKTYVFPITITKVEGDGRQGTPRTTTGDIAPYYEFRLTIDGMMERSDESNVANTRTSHFSIDRLTGYTNDDTLDRSTPRNIYATLNGGWQYTSSNKSEQSHTIEPTKPTIAARAIDDPIYFTDVTTAKTGSFTYSYLVLPELGRFDGDDTEDSVNGNTITGRCVVNTLFGDLVYKSESDIAGTSWTSSGGRAVITTYRHLYNIRKIHQNKNAEFIIVRNLDWYVHNTIKINGEATDLYTSEVRVFSVTGGNKSYSPVEQGVLKTVSFPAIPKIYKNHVLTSASSVSEKKSYSINNVQLRVASFINQRDDGYGLICSNTGTVYNLYTNNLNLIIAKVPNGANSDYSSICPDTAVSVGMSGRTELDNITNKKPRPIGGLIGTNTGKIGLENVDDGKNTISMKNPVVMAGQYWNAAAYDRTSGVVGHYLAGSSSYGVIELKGSFAVVGGGSNVSGVIADAVVDIGARIVVDGTSTSEKNEFNLPVLNETDEKMSCVIAGPKLVSAGIAWFEAGGMTYQNDEVTYSINKDEGRITFNEPAGFKYQIDINLPQGSLILQTAGNTGNLPVGGAIAKINKCNWEELSINVNNDGYIVTLDQNAQGVSVAGAVGVEDQCTIDKAYFNINNGEHSRIGALKDSKGCPVCAGGALGWINGNNCNQLMINAVNDGVIESRGSGNAHGSGGAIAAIADNVAKTVFTINVVNNENSHIECTGDSETYGTGTGGAIGGMGNQNTNNNTNIPVDSVIFAENHGTITGKRHVGGTIGNASTVNGKVYSVNYGTIKGTDYIGGTIGRLAYPQNDTGFVQSILNGASITGNNYVGGAAGRLADFRDGATVRTIVRGSSSIVSKEGSLVGGVCGAMYLKGSCSGSVELIGNNYAPSLTVNAPSGTGVGGAVGLMSANAANYATITTPDQSTSNKLILKVDGSGSVGGVIGKLRSTDKNTNNINDLLNASYQKVNIFINVSAVLHPQSYVSGTKTDVGGAIGFIDANASYYSGRISVRSVTGSSDGGSIIKGTNNVGGAVGRFGKIYPYQDSSDYGINVDFSAAPWTIEGTVGSNSEANVGGAVGIFDNYTDNSNYSENGYSDTNFPITVNLGSSVVKAAGSNVGGAIGKNLIRAGYISVTANGTIEGYTNVGGAIGLNRADTRSVEVNILGAGIIRGTADITNDLTNNDDYRGTNVGGAIGDNFAAMSIGITANISGKVISNGNNAGGAIGLCYSSNNTARWIEKIDVTLQGNSRIGSTDADTEINNVGGAIGCSLGSINSVKANITGLSKVIGNRRVGGTIGFATGRPNIDNASSKNGAGVIKRCEAVISADEALIGHTRVGGVIGQAAFKAYINNSNKWTYPVILVVRAEINASTLFDTESTGSDFDKPGDDAMVGGVFGQFLDGKVDDVILGGTGGVVNIDYPTCTYDHTVLIKANGRSVGGIVGQIGVEGLHSKVYLSHITVEKNGPYLCVVSGNGADRIGGWIGCGNGQYGGIGYTSKAQLDGSGEYSTYKVNNVRVVFSEGNGVGGFCGYMDTKALGEGGAGQPREIYSSVEIDFKGTQVIGRSEVGGAFGHMGYAIWKNGSITVNLSDCTNIGDLVDNVPGDSNNYEPICYEAGGAIGHITATSDRTSYIDIPVTVNVDSTSRICGLAGSLDDELSLDGYGVGGAIGRYEQTYFTNGNCRITVNAADPATINVISKQTNVGGVVGTIISGTINNSQSSFNDRYFNSNVAIKAEGDYSCAGGFVGSMIGGTVCCGRYTGTISATGSNSHVGGFVGDMSGGYIQSCYTTALVNSNGSFTGGFVGRMSKAYEDINCTIKNSYVGGHTYEGQYVFDEGNISGVNNVGGFVGAVVKVAGDTTIDTCYTTASVYGTGTRIGGFVGLMEDEGKISSTYCTGRVIGPKVTITDNEGNEKLVSAPTVGAFVGEAISINRFSNDRALSLINGGDLPLVGSVNGETEISPNNNITFMVYPNASSNDKGHPIDDGLKNSGKETGTYPFTVVLNSSHYGDWPLNVTGEIDIANAVVDLDPKEFDFDPKGITVENYLTVTIEGHELHLGTDYTLTYRNNDRAGIATVIISAKSGSVYYGTKTLTFNIKKVNFEVQEPEVFKAVIDPVQYDDEGNPVTPVKYEYTGAPIDPAVTVKLGENTLVLGKDYYLSYVFDPESEEEQDDPDNHTSIGRIAVSVNGIGNYEGVVEAGYFYIIGLNIDKAEVTLTNASAGELVYTGEEIKPGVVVRLGGRTLVEETDFKVDYDENVNAGTNTAKVVIYGIGNYSGTYERYFSISTAVNSWETKPTISNWVYGDDASTPVAYTKYGDVVFEYYTDEACNTPAMEDARTTPVDAGTYYLKAYANPSEVNNNGISNYGGVTPEIVSFKIEPANISSAVITVDPEEYEYIGEDVLPANISVMYGDTELYEGSDYTISYPSDVIGPGTITFTVIGVGNYTGHTTGSYDIVYFYAVEFDSQGGSEVKAQKVKEGSCAAEPEEAPTKIGYEFECWCTDQEGDIPFVFGETPINNAIKLYAKWVEAPAHTVKFHTDCDYSVETQTINHRDVALEPVTSLWVKDGYTFGGWYTDEQYTTPYEFALPVTEDKELYAKWVEIT